MKTKFFLAAGLLVTAFGYSQTTSYFFPTSGTTLANTPGTVGSAGTYIGAGTGHSVTAQTNWSTFVGFRAGYNTSGNSTMNELAFANTFVGAYAGNENTIGYDNVYIGAVAGRENREGIHNVCIGSEAAVDNTDGSSNVIVGAAAGAQSIGSSNIFIGKQAGFNNQGNQSVFIGHLAGSNEVLGHRLYIANSNTPNPLIYGEFDNNILKFNAQKVGIGFENGGFGDFPTNTLVDYTDYRLFVRGGILAEEVRVRLQAVWADYVFANDYELMPLNEVEQYITDNGHLPNMPSAEEVEEDGIALGNMVKLQQEKIEELTLHLIAQEKEMKELKAQVQLLLNKQ
ncbi:hypothetical protein DVK85_12595 [Flavobacterium arcticum]|uniref:Peptidase S74 domain-containing protein n=1 Tax=Flavobacterium arcticum TaxID=1784713 RepID=A0A345HEL5_9FLAO|nr:hypothetical protein [Flavobacterium arcticum]AXG75025.1 hypothetical protein DVK85_12595 [Flavobacterium arcticum]KAF2506577.1 hypothetical protein E0W72_13170 [Flavobacterium arcticum]